MYCISDFKDKSVFVHMGELGLMLDRKDFATNGCVVNEEHHPRSASKAVRRKEKAVVQVP